MVNRRVETDSPFETCLIVNDVVNEAQGKLGEVVLVVVDVGARRASMNQFKDGADELQCLPAIFEIGRDQVPSPPRFFLTRSHLRPQLRHIPVGACFILLSQQMKSYSYTFIPL